MVDVVVLVYDSKRWIRHGKFQIQEDSMEALKPELTKWCQSKYNSTPIVGYMQPGLPIPFVCTDQKKPITYYGMAIFWY